MDIRNLKPEDIGPLLRSYYRQRDEQPPTISALYRQGVFRRAARLKESEIVADFQEYMRALDETNDRVIVYPLPQHWKWPQLTRHDLPKLYELFDGSLPHRRHQTALFLARLL